MTRQEAVQIVGEAAVYAAERANCEPTSRCPPDGDTRMQWVAWHEIPGYLIGVYYYTDEEDSQRVEDNGGDWGEVDWVPDDYEVVDR